MPGESTSKPASSEDVDAIVQSHLDMDNPTSSAENTSSVGDTSNAGAETASNPTSESGDKLSDHEIDRITEVMQHRGQTAIIAASMNEKDRENVIAESIEMKANEETSKNKLIKWATKVPVFGAAIKAGYMHHYKKDAVRAIDKSGNLSDAYTALGLNPKSSKVLNTNTEALNDRAWQILENSGYSENNKIDQATSRLDQNDKVEKVNEATQSVIKQALNEYYLGLKEGKGKEELAKIFDEKVNPALENEKDANLLISTVNKEKEGLEKLAKDGKFTDEKIKSYLDNHLTLYRATMREGIYTKKEVDSLTKAVIASSTVGVAAAILFSREARSASRKAAMALGATNAVAGGIAGAVAGAIRGAEKARTSLSAHEINQATSFDEPSAEAGPVEAGGSAESGAEKAEEKAEKAEVSERRDKTKEILNKVKRFYKGEDILEKIDEKRDRKEAIDLILNLDELMEKVNPDDPSTLEALREAYAEAVARGRFSSENNVDLIKYKDPEDRSSLEKKLAEAEKKLFGDNPEDIERGLDPANITESAIQEQINKLAKNYEEAKNLESKFKARSVAVNAVMGAVIGAGAGAVIGAWRAEHFNAEGAVEGDNKIELAEDADGGYTVKLGGEELIGKGDEAGIDFNSDGTLTAESQELLKNAGIEVEAHESEPIEIAHSNMNIREFFNSSNREANNLTEITSRSWKTDAFGRDQVIMGDTHMDGEGNIIMQVVPTQNSNVDLDDMKMVITAGDGNIDNGIVVDVNPDGTVEIPAGSPAASLFDGNEFQGGYAELANIDADGHMDVYHTIGDGHPDVSTISVPNSDVTYTDGYTFTIDGESQEIALPDEIAASAKMEAINGIESARGLGEPVYSETTGELTNLQTTSGEAVEVAQFEHHGGYSDVYDSYFGEKDGVYNSGASLVRQMLGDEANGLSSQEADQLFLEKINSGEISEGTVIEDYLNAIGNSPEALVTTRAMMGDFMMDLDGDGVMDLVDTQDKINLAADIISSGDSEAYDNFANDTYSIFYEKIAGGSIRFVDQAQEQYQYTTWGVLGDDNNILQRLGVVGNRPTDGVGIVFMDKDGNSIYDEETVRKLWHLPDNYDINYVADRLDCIQKTARGFFDEKTTGEKTTDEKTTGEKTTDEKTTSEKTTDEKTTSEKTTDEKTTNEKTTNEKTTEEKTTSEKTTGEKSTEEKTTSEKTTGEKSTAEDTIEPKDYENMQRIDDNIDQGDEHDIGTDEIQNHTDLGTGEKTEQPSSSDYQGTEPKVVQNETSKPAVPVQEKVSEPNNYSNDNGGAHQNEYQPVKPDSAATEAANNRGDTAADSSGIDDVLKDAGIN